MPAGISKTGLIIPSFNPIGSMFPEKLVFDGLVYRKGQVNKASKYILTNSS